MIERKILEINLNNWLEEQRLADELSDNTIKIYKQSIIKFISYLNDNRIENITKQTMIDYKKQLIKISNSTKSQNIWIIALNKYLKYLKLNNLCLKQIKVQNKFIVKSNLTLSDYKRLLRIAKREEMFQDYLIIQTICKTGIRFSELKFFTVENLGIDKKGVIIISSKGKVRDIEIPTILAQDLRKYARLNKIKEGYIFRQVKDHHKLVASSTFWKHLQKIAGIAKVNKSKCHAHNLRHLFAVEFLKTHNNNTLALASILGHSSLNTTRIYSTLTTEEKRAMLDAMKL